ncbi:anti-sigma regulatory factor (Ser/Thr protein kinase) [Pseudomonas putida]|nr:anti-sigma regulatory factor (Ser/Thr protein kinase) [Pseudomonas sp. PvP089]MBP2090526.1 anti-sigma regulatory factor (Ser/Thr protein kinase) [Pseudomonas sp. PvP088]MBP2223310.1 anti-sigma regulatory factor (Ser/Thr protein kinase) [Pseudomonas putida]
MSIRQSGSQPVRVEQDVVLARQLTRKLATDCGMRLVDLTKLVTAVSELARNTVVYGGGRGYGLGGHRRSRARRPAPVVS